MNQLNHQHGRILSVADTTYEVSVENVADFAPFGLTTEFFVNYKSKISEAKEIVSDLTERNMLKSLTSHKEEVLAKCFKWGRDLILRFELEYSSHSPEMENFPRKDLQKAKKCEFKMIKVLKTYIKLAEKHNESLVTHGLTPEEIQKGKDLISELDNAEIAQEVKKVLKKNLTTLRNEIFYDLYKTTVKIYKIARSIYVDVPEKLVMYKSPWPKHVTDSISVYEGFVDPLSSVEIAEDISQDSELHIENKGTTELMFYVSNNGEENTGITINAGLIANILLSEIGIGRFLKVLNKGETEKGEYKVEV